jgi:hypothetical protein
MRKGQVIHGYKVLQDFSTAGSGLSKWTYAEKERQTYFLKERIARQRRDQSQEETGLRGL